MIRGDGTGKEERVQGGERIPGRKKGYKKGEGVPGRKKGYKRGGEYTSLTKKSSTETIKQNYFTKNTQNYSTLHRSNLTSLYTN
jgi:hypothetical protein